MTSEITNYQCPACTGPLHFTGATGRLECEYCGSSYSVEEIEALYAEREKKALDAAGETEKAVPEGAEESDWDMSGLNEDWGNDADGMKTYSCPSCATA